MIPPDKKLKLGIDLSGGTILVYEVARENLGPNFNMDELISALKQRADPQGVKETPIRKIGSNRIEIILPLANDEEVEEVKKMLTDVGSLEFRILANRKHDAAAVDRALGPQGLAKPPARYKWARLGEISTGTSPTFTSDTITDLQQKWKKDFYAGTDVTLTGKGDEGPDQTVTIPVSRNTANTLTLARPHGLKSISSYRIEYNPSAIHGGDPSNPRPTDPIVREEKVAPGRTELYILCTLDRQNVTGKLPVADLRHDRRAASAGRRIPVQPPGRPAVRPAHPRAPSRGRRRVQVSTGDPAGQPGDVGPVDQLRDPRFGHHRGGRPGVQAQGSPAPDQHPPGGQLAGKPEPNAGPGGKGRPHAGRRLDRQGLARHLGVDAGRADLHDLLLPVRRHRGRHRPGRQHDPVDRDRWPSCRPRSRCPAWPDWR